ncbi:MAG: DUF6306 domain-containing protein [Pseudomonadales bacterium]
MNEDDREYREYASPPCFAHELQDGCAVPLTLAELTTQLNVLLEGERAGARGLIGMAAGCPGEDLRRLLEQVARDEAACCSMLIRHLKRLGGAPSRETGVFYDKLQARESLQERLRLLDRGQTAVVRTLDGLLRHVDDPALRTDLEHMRALHVRNVALCAGYLDS